MATTIDFSQWRSGAVIGDTNSASSIFTDTSLDETTFQASPGRLFAKGVAEIPDEGIFNVRVELLGKFNLNDYTSFYYASTINQFRVGVEGMGVATLKGLSAKFSDLENDFLDSTLNGNNNIIGTAFNDTLLALSGNDIVSGGAGNDLINGGRGADRLTGGKGADRFEYLDIQDSRPSAKTRDQITDFQGRSGDIIVINDIDANTIEAGNQAFRFIGASAFSGIPGEIRYSAGILQFNINQDKAADMEILLTGNPQMQSSFFVL